MLSSKQRSSGQAAIEYMMVFGIALMLSAPFILRAQSSIVELRMGSNAVEMHNTMNKFESAIKTVEASGKPARRTFIVEIPSNVEAAQIQSDAIVYNLSTTDGEYPVIRSFDVNVTGNIPTSEGKHRVTAEAKSNSVNLSVVS